MSLFQRDKHVNLLHITFKSQIKDEPISTGLIITFNDGKRIMYLRLSIWSLKKLCFEKMIMNKKGVVMEEMGVVK